MTQHQHYCPIRYTDGTVEILKVADAIRTVESQDAEPYFAPSAPCPAESADLHSPVLPCPLCEQTT